MSPADKKQEKFSRAQNCYISLKIATEQRLFLFSPPIQQRAAAHNKSLHKDKRFQQEQIGFSNLISDLDHITL